MGVSDAIAIFLPYLSEYGYYALFFIFFLGIVGFPVPEETLLVLAGFLVYTGTFEYIPTVFVSFFGTVSAMTTAYWLGRRLGYPFILRYGAKIGLKRKFIAKTERWFKRVGKFAIPLGYFIPGVRQFSAYFAGINRLGWGIFILLAYSGGLVWSVTFVTLGYKLGQNWRKIFDSLSYSIGLAAAGVLFLLVLGYFAFQYFRRKSVGSNG
ncbi:hypothetical protein BSNK01_27860 [Bacillaceae bacterium]